MSGRSLGGADRLAQYKTGKHSWKETFRRRCLDRLRQNRAEMYDARRGGIGAGTRHGDGKDKEQGSDSFIQMVLSSELQALKQEEGMDDRFSVSVHSKGEIDMTLALIDEIQDEMKAEEAKLIAEYEIYQASLRNEEAALCNAIEMLNTHPICPICTKSPLMENKGIVFCKCGIRIFTEQDGITLDFVERQLQEGKEMHHCDGQPVFTIQEKYGLTSLYMTCQVCDFVYIVV